MEEAGYAVGGNFVLPKEAWWENYYAPLEARLADLSSKYAGDPVAQGGLLFVAIGLYMVPGKFLVDARARRRTFYGLTDQRAIIVSGLFSTTVNSILRRTLSDVSVEQRRDGSGTIFFGQKNAFDAMYSGMSWPGFEPTPRFEMIPDVREVYRLLLRQG